MAAMKPQWKQFEAFFHIGRHGGIPQAARARGVDPSALRHQLTAFEKNLGVVLCSRQPFRLTPPGRTLFAAIERAHALLREACDEVAADAAPQLRFVATELISHHYLPDVIAEVERRHPGLECSTESASESRMPALLRDDLAHVAIAPDGGRWDAGWSRARLLELPLVVLVPKASPLRAAAELWARPEITETLFVSAAAGTMLRQFDAGLRGLQVEWKKRRRVGSVATVAAAVAAGRGYGLGLDVPEVVAYPRIRVLPLPNFPRVPIAMVWRGPATREIKTAVELLRLVARKLAATDAGR